MSAFLAAACTRLRPTEDLTPALFCFVFTALPITTNPSMLHGNPTDVATQQARTHQHAEPVIGGSLQAKPVQEVSSPKQVPDQPERSDSLQYGMGAEGNKEAAYQYSSDTSMPTQDGGLQWSIGGVPLQQQLRYAFSSPHLSTVFSVQSLFDTAVAFAKHSTDALAAAGCFDSCCLLCSTLKSYSSKSFSAALHLHSAVGSCTSNESPLYCTLLRLVLVVIGYCCSLSLSFEPILQQSCSAAVHFHPALY